MNRAILKHYCTRCEKDSNFVYVSSNVAAAGNPERHFYSCRCGETYTLDKLLTLENIALLHKEDVTTR